MARTLDQIIAELNPTFQPQVQSLQAQQQLIPQEIQSQETALNAQKDVAYSDIVDQARRRGVGFSGIPLGEQAKYAATQYAPALAGLRQQGQQKAMSLQDAILGINERRDTLGQQIYQTETDRAFQAQQAEANRRAQAAAAAASRPTLGGLGSGGGSAPAPKAIVGRVDQVSPGNFRFYDAGNKTVTAGTYARNNNLDIRDVLYDLGQGGDRAAAGYYNLLRTIPNDQYKGVLTQLAKQAPQLFNGYIVGGAPAAPLNYTQPTARTQTAQRPNTGLASGFNGAYIKIPGAR